MCSSRLDRETGVVTITTPCAWAEVGHTLYACWSAQSYAIDPADWLVRLVGSRPGPNGKPWGVGVDTAAAELQLAMRYGLVHESLVEEPSAA